MCVPISQQEFDSLYMYTLHVGRSAWRKMHPEETAGSPGGSTSGVLRRDESSDPAAAKSAAASTGHLLPEEVSSP